MNHPNRSLRAILTGVCALSTLVALWQFYRFVQFRDAAGGFAPQGGTFILLLAVGAAVVACAAGGYVAFSVVNHDEEDVMHITTTS